MGGKIRGKIRGQKLMQFACSGIQRLCRGELKEDWEVTTREL